MRTTIFNTCQAEGMVQSSISNLQVGSQIHHRGIHRRQGYGGQAEETGGRREAEFTTEGHREDET
jgi:hypothetical protein